MTKPLLAITMGDPAGVGPEVIVRAWSNPQVHDVCQPVVFGHPQVLRQAVELVGGRLDVIDIANIEEASQHKPDPQSVLCLPVGSDDVLQVPHGTVDARTAQAAYDALLLATDAALAGTVQGVVTAPLSKSALHAAGHKYPGHTDLYAEDVAESTIRWRGIHMLTGTSAALAVVLVHSIAVTYFIGTSRWCKEVTETYQLDPEMLRQSTLLKRRTFPWCLLGMLGVVGVAALGAASDPGTGGKNTAFWADVHFVAALAGLAVIAWTYYRAWLNIVGNQAVIQQIVDAVAVIRRERGLDTEEPAAVVDSGRRGI